MALINPQTSADRDDELRAGASIHDVMFGREGNDRFFGNSSEDTMDGGAGNDTLTGGGSADSFLFTSAPGAANADVITDFASGVGKIHLDATVMSALGTSGNFAAGGGAVGWRTGVR